MKTYYLKTTTLNQLKSKLPFAFDDEGNTITKKDFTIDLIGSIIKTQGVYDDEGIELTPPEFYSGYHANIKCSDEIYNLIPKSILVEVSNPKRKFYE